MSVFGTARDFDSGANTNSPFVFNDSKDGPTKLVKHVFKRPNTTGLNELVSRHNLPVSWRGCQLQFWARAGEEGLIAVGRRNGGIVSTRVTIMYYAELENRQKRVGCKLRVVIMQPLGCKRESHDPFSAARQSY